MASLFSAGLMHYFKIDMIKSPLWEFSFPSVANMLSSWCQYEALKYVSFPTAMLGKAFKSVPIMLMGKLMHDKTYESYEYGTAVVVGFGLYLFLDSSEKIDFTENVIGEPESIKGAWCGVVLLLLFLAFDSFTGQWQARMFNIHKHVAATNDVGYERLQQCFCFHYAGAPRGVATNARLCLGTFGILFSPTFVHRL